MADELQIESEPFGPDPAVIQELTSSVLRHPAVLEQLEGTEHRLLSLELVEPGGKVRRPTPPRDYLATIFDYTGNRAVLASGSLADPTVVAVEELGIQPLPSPDEFEAAVDVVREDPELGAALRDERLQPYPAVPALVGEELPDGRLARTLAVGLLPGEGEKGHEIVGVNLLTRAITRFDGGAPPNAAAHNPICGLSYAAQPTTPKGTAGQVWVTVSQGGTVLWRFLVVRPAASSGTNGSGVELRFVDYRGKRVLYRAHVPILNVKYDSNACGPYLDWQWQEGMLQANGTDVAPGFRLASSPATTILQSGNDTGNFLGVAIYVQGQEVVLVSEMQAGWYRYVSEWRLHTDGTIRPRFGFGAVQSSCVCTRHHHHVYWRLDFDIRTPGDNVVTEFNDPPLFGGSNWHTKHFEIKRPRDPSRKRKWQVTHATSGDAYEIQPGHDDGVATASPDWPFPQGDVWLLRYRGTELDHGTVATGPPYEANLDTWVTGETIERQDVVVWYAGHVIHDVTAEPPGHFGHIVGPELRPVRW
jgi:hypothetical protein